MWIQENNEHPSAVSGGAPHGVREPGQDRCGDSRLLPQHSLEIVDQDHLVAARFQRCLDGGDRGPAGKVESRQRVAIQRRCFFDRPGDKYAINPGASRVGKTLGEFAHLIPAAHPAGDAGRKTAARAVMPV